jgi:hypothetical protein
MALALNEDLRIQSTTGNSAHAGGTRTAVVFGTGWGPSETVYITIPRSPRGNWEVGEQ